jgi:hypothetical protein
MDEQLIKRLNVAISAILVAGGAMLLLTFLDSRKAEAPAEEPVSTTEAGQASETQEYDDLAGMASLELAKDFASWTPGAKVDDAKTRSLDLAVEGSPKKAYLTVRVSIEGKPLSRYESVYVKLNDVGGHLFRPDSLKTPETEGATSLLYDLSDVSILPSVPYDETRTPETADLAALLKDGKTVRLTAFISSLKPALIEELTLRYVCAEGESCDVRIK